MGFPAFGRKARVGLGVSLLKAFRGWLKAKPKGKPREAKVKQKGSTHSWGVPPHVFNIDAGIFGWGCERYCVDIMTHYVHMPVEVRIAYDIVKQLLVILQGC